MNYSQFLFHFHGEKYIRTMPVRRIFKTMSYLKIKINKYYLTELQNLDYIRQRLILCASNHICTSELLTFTFH